MRTKRFVMYKFQANKYKAKPVVEDGHRFDSKLEHAVHCRLKQLQMAGEVSYWLRQVPFHLPGGITYKADYQVFYKNGAIRYLDPKGVETQTFKLKKKLVEHHYPVIIEVIKRVGQI